jgi:hypothetical protein
MKNILLFFSAALLISGCLEYQEKMKLNSDGSGEVIFAFGISESLLNIAGSNNDLKDFDESKIKEEFNNKKGVKVLSSRTYLQAGQRWIEINIAFESLEYLISATADSTQKTILGEISLSERSDGKMVFTRKLYKEPVNTVDDTTNDAVSQGMMEMMFGHFNWNYQLTLPGKIISSNAAQNDIDYSTNMVKWTVSMASISKPQLMTVTFEKPIPKYKIILMLVLVIVVIVAVILIMLKLKNKQILS